MERYDAGHCGVMRPLKARATILAFDAPVATRRICPAERIVSRPIVSA